MKEMFCFVRVSVKGDWLGEYNVPTTALEIIIKKRMEAQYTHGYWVPQFVF